jgi:hypothetical protein
MSKPAIPLVPVRLDLGAARGRLRAGEPFAPDVRTDDGGRPAGLIDLGDGSAPVPYPLWDHLRYKQPGRYALRFYSQDLPADVSLAVTVEGPLSLTVSPQFTVADEERLHALGTVGSDNVVGRFRDPRDPARVVSFFAGGGSYNGVMDRVVGTLEDPVARPQITYAPVLFAEAFPPRGYLNAGPVYYDADTGTLLMAALHGPGPDVPGKENVPLVYGSVRLLWSADLGLTWRDAGPVFSPQVPYAAWAQDPEIYASYANGGTAMVRAGDWLVLLAPDFGGPLVGERGDPANFNPTALCRAPLAELVRHVRAGRPAADLWRKRYLGQWSEPGLGGRSDCACRAGGSQANHVIWSSHLNRWLMLSQPANDASTFQLSWSYDLLDATPAGWSAPQTVHVYGRPGWYAWCGHFALPAGEAAGRRLSVWFGCWGWDGGEAWKGYELAGVEVEFH